jgi:hypothetical protein
MVQPISCSWSCLALVWKSRFFVWEVRYGHSLHWCFPNSARMGKYACHDVMSFRDEPVLHFLTRVPGSEVLLHLAPACRSVVALLAFELLVPHWVFLLDAVRRVFVSHMRLDVGLASAPETMRTKSAPESLSQMSKTLIIRTPDS